MLFYINFCLFIGEETGKAVEPRDVNAKSYYKFTKGGTLGKIKRKDTSKTA